MNAYEILGIHPQSTRAELDAAYRARRAAYDLSKIVGIAPELQVRAQTQLVEIDRAYLRLRRALALPPALTDADERRRDRETIIALIAMVMIVLIVLGLQPVAVPQRTVAVEQAGASVLKAQPAPDFNLAALDGTEMTLSHYKGRIVLVNFWATWCPPCVREMPGLIRIYTEYRDRGFVILGINTAYQDERAKVEQFVSDNTIPFPILLDTDGHVGQSYGSRLMPTSYLIDQQGRIVYTRIGQIDEQTLAEQIDALLLDVPNQP